MRLGLISSLLISLLLVTIAIAGIWYYLNLTRNLPSIETLPILLEPPNGTLLQPTRIYDRTHEHVILTLENPAAAGKQYLHVGTNGQAGINQASQYLEDATLAINDPGFWKEPGYNLSGISEGTHATLAQQLISNLILDTEPPSIKRNIWERMLAAQATSTFGREKILEWYLNNAQYGELIYGADAAARVYFGKSATQLSVAEAAMLTTIAETPSVSPLIISPYLKDQQELVIQRMLVYGFINAEEAQKALKEDIQLQPQKDAGSIAPAFTSLVLKQLSSVVPLERIDRGGFEIVTTLNYDLQEQTACALKAQLARLQGTQEPAITDDGIPCEAASLLPSLQSAIEKPMGNLYANLVILEPDSGQILALVGEGRSGTEPANPEVHPAGSIVAPFLYLTAFTRGMSPATLVWDIQRTNENTAILADQSDIPDGSPVSYHGPVRLRMAFVNDYMGAAAEVLQKAGPENVWLTEKQFGISTSGLGQSSGKTLDDLYSQRISLLGSVEAYGILANQGVMAGQPEIEGIAGNEQAGLNSTSILSVTDGDGQIWLDWTIPKELPIVSPQLAYLTTNVLNDEKARWSTLGHPNALEIGRPAAAKVSLTRDANNAWAVGYIPQLAVGVWMGTTQTEAGGISVEMPAGLWHAVMQYASSQLPVQDFTVPTGISEVQVCDPSGMLASPLCPGVVQEVFLSGNEPTQIDNLYQKLAINRETGLLATIFTPSNMVEDKVYLVVPPEATAWAKDAGLPVPPGTYDTIYAPPPSSGDVNFAQPQMFDQVRGQIELKGSAQGENFSYYRLQVGKGLNPQQWIQIGVDVNIPVSEGLLGTWDTTGLEGLYVVQLLVVRQDLRVDQAILQVTIDNTIPQVEILAPKKDQHFTTQQNEPIVMNVSASDNLIVQRVEFYIDDELESTLLEPPYIILWRARLGAHTLAVKVVDVAGNHNAAEISFTVDR